MGVREDQTFPPQSRSEVGSWDWTGLPYMLLWKGFLVLCQGPRGLPAHQRPYWRWVCPAYEREGLFAGLIPDLCWTLGAWLGQPCGSSSAPRVCLVQHLGRWLREPCPMLLSQIVSGGLVPTWALAGLLCPSWWTWEAQGLLGSLVPTSAGQTGCVLAFLLLGYAVPCLQGAEDDRLGWI